MKIAMVSEQASPLHHDLGQGTYVAALAAAMSALHHDVTVYTRREDSTSPERVRTDDGYDVVRVPIGSPAGDEVPAHLGDFAEFLAEQWRPRPPDVVHAHHWTSGLAALIAAHRSRVPVLHSHHGLGPRDAEQRAGAEALVARRAAWTVATNSAETTALRALGVRRTRVSMVPYGVDVELFHPDGPAAERGRLKRVVTAAEPGHGNVVDDLAATLSTMDGVELVVVGAEQRGRVRELGRTNRVVFVGPVHRAQRPALLRSADLVVCTPAAEPFGILALEAMACGVPVVATAVGAPADAVVHNVTGLLVAPHDLRALTRALRRSLSDSTLREELGTAARDRVLARYSTSRLAAEMEAVYQQVHQSTSERTAAHEIV